MTEAKYNPRNPAVKRIFKAQDPSEFSRSKGIFQEIQEMAKDDSLDFVAQAFEVQNAFLSNLYESFPRKIFSNGISFFEVHLIPISKSQNLCFFLSRCF